MNKSEFLKQLNELKVFNRDGRRAPHKPLTVLYALGQLQTGITNLLYSEVQKDLDGLIQNFLPSDRAPRSQYPFCRLQSDGFWELDADKQIIPGHDPSKKALIDAHASAGFRSDILAILQTDERLVIEAAKVVLDGHFPESIHDEVANAAGLSLEDTQGRSSRNRDPKFRERILIAYRYQCGVCGYCVRRGNIPVGLEAAHIKWHQAMGPDTEDNGIALCSIHHKLFDWGVFTVNHDHAIEVSRMANGVKSDEIILAYDGKALLAPGKNAHRPASEFLDWHRREVYVN